MPYPLRRTLVNSAEHSDAILMGYDCATYDDDPESIELTLETSPRDGFRTYTMMDGSGNQVDLPASVARYLAKVILEVEEYAAKEAAAKAQSVNVLGETMAPIPAIEPITVAVRTINPEAWR